ncbi:hypothetical protein V2O64_16160 [Verrucomicrobiaceae bacterium 227]
MKTAKTHLISTGLLVFAAAAIVGWKSKPHSAPADSPSPPVSASSRNPGSTSYLGMRNIRSQRTEGERMRSAIEMARTLPSSEIRAWLDQGKFNLRSGFAMTLFQKIAFERWAREEPSGFLAWTSINASSNDTTLIADAVKNHPEAIESALASLETTEQKEVLIGQIAAASPDLALAELRKLLASPESANYAFSSAFSALVKHRPEELEKLLGEIKGPARDRLEQVVYSAKLEKDFEGTLAELYEMPNGYEFVLGQYSYSISQFLKPGELLSHLASFPESWRTQAANNASRFLGGFESAEQFSAFDWEGLGFTAAQTGKIQFQFLIGQVQKKPEDAFASMADFTFSESQKEQILQVSLYRSRTEEDLTNLRNQLSSPGDRALFDKVSKAHAPLIASNRASPTNIETPAQLVESLTKREVSNLASVITNWDPGQKEELVATYHELTGGDKDYLSSLLIDPNSGVSTNLRSEALEHLLTLPEDSEFSSWKGPNGDKAAQAASLNALNLMQIDPAQATRWLAELPEGPVRLMARKNLAVNWRNYEPEAVKKWVSTLPANEQTEINNFLKSK